MILFKLGEGEEGKVKGMVPYPGKEMVKMRCVASGRVVGVSKNDSSPSSSSSFLSWLPIIMMASIEQDAFSSYSCVCSQMDEHVGGG